MFQNVLEVKGLRKLNEVGKKLSGITVPLPLEKEILDGRKELETNLGGRVHKTYTKNVLIAYHYSDSHLHYKTGNSMLNDINNNKKIYMNSYK